MKIYVAGPLSPKTKDLHDAAREQYHNVRKAILIGNALIEKGHHPYIPHLYHFAHLESTITKPVEFWYKFDLSWLDVCDGLFFISSSRGADQELEYAKKKGLQIFYNLEDVPNA